MLQIETFTAPFGRQLISAGEKLNEISVREVNSTKAFRALNGFCYMEMLPGVALILLGYENMGKTIREIPSPLSFLLVNGLLQYLAITVVSSGPADKITNNMKISTLALPLTGRVLKSIGNRLAA